jgi:hypothetical protein
MIRIRRHLYKRRLSLQHKSNIDDSIHDKMDSIIMGRYGGSTTKNDHCGGKHVCLPSETSSTDRSISTDDDDRVLSMEQEEEHKNLDQYSLNQSSTICYSPASSECSIIESVSSTQLLNQRVQFSSHVDITPHLSRHDMTDEEKSLCFWSQAERKLSRRVAKSTSLQAISDFAGSDHPLQRACTEAHRMAWTLSRSNHGVKFDATNSEINTYLSDEALERWCLYNHRGLERLVRNAAEFHPHRKMDHCEHLIKQNIRRIVRCSQQGLNGSSIATLSTRLSLPDAILAQLIGQADAHLG